MFTTTSRYVKRLNESTIQSWMRTIVVLIYFNKIGPLFTAYHYEFYLFIFFILVPNFLISLFWFFLIFLNNKEGFYRVLCFLIFDVDFTWFMA